MQTEEDLAKKQNLELLVTRVQDPEDGIVHNALVALRSEIASSTSSMTAVPKPLKFLRPHFDTLRTTCDAMKDGANKVRDIINVALRTMC
jgi:26S proteasome regulatory subunit N1